MEKKFVQDYKKKEGEDQFSYVGDYYIFSMEETEKKRRSVFQILFVVIQMILIVTAGFLNSPGTYKIYIVLPYLCMILPLMYYLMGAVSFTRIPKKMEKRQYEVTLFRMMKSIIAIVLLCTFTVGADGIFLMRNRDKIEKIPESLFLGIMIILAVMDYVALIRQNQLQKCVTVEKQEEKK